MPCTTGRVYGCADLPFDLANDAASAQRLVMRQLVLSLDGTPSRIILRALDRLPACCGAVVGDRVVVLSEAGQRIERLHLGVSLPIP